jgi:hypothetical protein
VKQEEIRFGMLLAAVAGLALLAGCNPMKFEVIPEAAVDQSQRTAAESFASTVLSGWNEGRYTDVSHLLTEEMASGFSVGQQGELAAASLKECGRFLSMSYVETQRSVPAQFVIYRFKADYEKRKGWEIRVVYDVSGKIGGFWTKPWRDRLG